MLTTSQKFFDLSVRYSQENELTENHALKPKFEVQDAHFSRKQYSLLRAVTEPGENKYAYYLSDDTIHDPVFVHQRTFFNSRTSKMRL